MSDDRILESFRRWGYLQADLDPLGRIRPEPHPELDAGGEGADRARAIYCGKIGAEFGHIPDPARRGWIARRMESPTPPPPGERDRLLELLIRAYLFERVAQTRYPGTKRFSLEGATFLLPLLHELLDGAILQGAVQAVIGMSHRGRLNVTVHVVGKRAADIFAGFEDVDPSSLLGGGDVKYHLGAVGEFRSRTGHRLHIHLVSNPSHLEAVDPVALGRTRAKQLRLGPRGRALILPILLHGDSAFAGQGMVAETLNLANLRGYTVGGTIHVIVNNLIGYTTLPRDSHSNRFCTGVARTAPVPIFHVNGEAGDAVLHVARMALEYRFVFGSDVVIDVIGYRKHGHSEQDDPTTTSPVVYAEIARRPPLYKVYAEHSGADATQVTTLEERIENEYKEAQKEASSMRAIPVLRKLPDYWSPYTGGPWTPEVEADTGVPAERIRQVAGRMTAWPAGFAVHPRAERLYDERRAMGAGEKPVDWGTAELLAFGTLLWDGTPVRMSGQDSRRGTFNQRHSTLYDTRTEEEYVPLQHLHPRQGVFEIWDSPLSENAPLGFEFGFSRDYPEALVLWEAQFGDFANSAQVIIDQFLSATEDKWGLWSGLVLLLPHGYAGQGPEHSSARPERWLQLCAEDNMQVVSPTTAAQYFHLLRRQVLRRWRKPLVVMTPKAGFHDRDVVSPLEDFTRGRFRRVLPDPGVTSASRLLLCSGKIGRELRAEREKRGDRETGIATIEQLYPFPGEEIAEILSAHPGAREVVWVQEEPANMGALFFVLPRLEPLLGERTLRTVSRPANASPATGSAKAHAMEQQAVLEGAFAPED